MSPTFFPQSRGGLRNIHGIGAVKLERYGDLFLDIIREYCQGKRIAVSGPLEK